MLIFKTASTPTEPDLTPYPFHTDEKSPSTALSDAASPDEASASGGFRPLGWPLEAAAAGQRADEYLARRYRFLSRSAWQKRLRDGKLLVNKSRVKVAYRLKAGDQLDFYHPPTAEPEIDRGIRVLWEQAGVMAVYKTGMLPMHENGAYRKNTFKELVRTEIGPEWAAVHRLDRETSGIVLCGATPAIRMALAGALERHQVRKHYLAIAVGRASRAAWTVDGPIGDLQESLIRIKKWVVPGGLSATTHFECLAQAGEHTLLKAIPVTGRTNQIRIHAAYAGLPLKGDKLYHPDEQVFLDYFAYGNTPEVQEKAGFARHCLHAAYLRFEHPVSRAVCEVSSPLPDDMTLLWQALGGSRDALAPSLGGGFP